MAQQGKQQKKSDESWGYLLVTAAVGIGLFAALRKKDILPESRESTVIPSSTTSKTTSFKTRSSFPLSKGSRGALVTALQNLLLQLGGKSAAEIKASGGADGIFGSGTEKALLEAGFSKVITQSDYDRLSQLVKRQNASGKVVKGDTDVYVFVDSFFLDEPIYKNVVQEENYFHGRKVKVTNPKGLITKLPHRMYIGKATGKTIGKYIQVKSTLNGIDYFVWVDKGETTVQIFKEADLHHYLTLQKGIQKTREVINNIIAAFS